MSFTNGYTGDLVVPLARFDVNVDSNVIIAMYSVQFVFVNYFLEIIGNVIATRYVKRNQGYRDSSLFLSFSFCDLSLVSYMYKDANLRCLIRYMRKSNQVIKFAMQIFCIISKYEMLCNTINYITLSL